MSAEEEGSNQTLGDAINYLVGAGWSYCLELDACLMMADGGRCITGTHRAMVDDNQGHVAECIEREPHLALARAIRGVWRMRGGE